MKKEIEESMKPVPMELDTYERAFCISEAHKEILLSRFWDDAVEKDAEVVKFEHEMLLHNLIAEKSARAQIEKLKGLRN